MPLVLDYMDIESPVEFRFRSTIFGAQVLQIGRYSQPWDTNTGKDYGPPVLKWKDACEAEALKYLFHLIEVKECISDKYTNTGKFSNPQKNRNVLWSWRKHNNRPK